MNTKPIPAIVMLTAGFAACIISIVNGYSLSFLIRRLFVVLICFLILGFVIKTILDITCRKPEMIEVTAQDLGFEDGEIIMDEEDLQESEEEKQSA